MKTIESIKPLVLAALRAAPAGRSVSRSALVAATGSNDRLNRLAIAELRKEGEPIVEMSETPGGYRLARTPEDLDDTIERMGARLRSLAVVRAGLRRARLIVGKVKIGSQVEMPL